jgi:general secretion pathway protein E/type IV pilus assembly protein PilB
MQLRRWLANQDIHLYKPRGCEKCLYSGYFGRLLIIEYLEINAKVKKLLAKPSDLAQLAVTIDQLEITSMWQDGIRRVAEGYTTLDEVIRVVNIDQDLDNNAGISI